MVKTVKMVSVGTRARIKTLSINKNTLESEIGPRDV